MKLLRYFEKSQEAYLLIVSFVFFLLRFPSLFEPYWYGDEGIYFTIGEALRHGRLLYQGAWDNKPPLLYLFYQIFGGSLFEIRFISLAFGVGAVISFYFLVKELFRSIRLGILSSFLLALFLGLPTLEGNIANAENFMVFPIILGFYFFFREVPIDKTGVEGKLKAAPGKILFLSGLLLGVGFLFKIVGIFDLFALVFFLFLITLKGSIFLRNVNEFIRNYFVRLIYLFFGFLVPTIIYGVVTIFQGNFLAFLQSTYLQNVSYVAYENNFLIPHGLLIIKTIVILLVLFVIYKKKDFFQSSTFLFSVCLLAMSLYNVFFSQRPYGHYLLLITPSMILTFLCGIVYKKFRNKIFFTLGLLSVLLIFTFNLFLLPRTFSYYGNFLSFVTNNIDTNSYMSFFDKNTTRDYTLATFIKSHTGNDQNVYIWGDSAQIYFMSHKLPVSKYVVSYHVDTTYGKTLRKLIDNSNTKYIIIMPDTLVAPFTLAGYKYRMTIGGASIYERI